jgi:hypothetical protein
MNGRDEEARGVASVGSQRLRQLAERLHDPHLQQCYLEAVPENAALIAFAEES